MPEQMQPSTVSGTETAVEDVSKTVSASTDVSEQSPASDVTPANAIEGGREVSNKILYVGNIDKSVTEEFLRDVFKIGGPIVTAKILQDKNKPSHNYAFVEYERAHDARVAFEQLDGKLINESTVKINWAFQSQQVKSDENHNLFIGDLSVDVNDEALKNAFSEYASFVQAHVMWDMQTGRSRGYGFVSFGDQADAERALEEKNGLELNGRAIRLNWASRRQQQKGKPKQDGQAMFDQVVRQTPHWLTTVYIGNIAHSTTQQEMLAVLQNFGYIVDFKWQQDKCCAFVKYDTHEHAAGCIVSLASYNMNGRFLKTGWGKEKPPVFIPGHMMVQGMPPQGIPVPPHAQQPEEESEQ